MGPRPDGRGRLDAPCRLLCRLACVNGAAAGWPRKVGASRSSRSWQSCVNGAAAGWPRKGYKRNYSSWLTERQWGRGRMAAEGRARVRRAGARNRVNGAAAGWPRKVCHAAAEADDRGCVNGAAAGWPRKVRIREDGHSEMDRVNGAAAGWPRKASVAWNRRRPSLASMGPRPDGRGRRHGLGLPLEVVEASMGPRPDGRGRRGTGGSTRGG